MATTTAPRKTRTPRQKKNPDTVTAGITATKTRAKSDTRQVLVNPFKAGDSVVIPSGTVFTSAAPTAKGRQVVKRSHKVTVSDIVPAKVAPRNSEKGSKVMVRPSRIRAKGSGGYAKDITLTVKIVKLNGKTPTYEAASMNENADA